MTILDRFFSLEKDAYGDAGGWFKTDRLSSKLIAFYVRPFNPRYLTHVTTTRGNYTALPESRRDDPESAVRTEFHENVHKFDSNESPTKFFLGYAYPQILAVPFLLAATGLAGLWGLLGLGFLLLTLHVGLCILHGASREGKRIAGKVPLYTFAALAVVGGASFILACVYGAGAWSALLLGSALFISPWPFKAKFRRDIELRGYTMTLYRKWLEGQYYIGSVGSLVPYFTGASYFFMETDSLYVLKELEFQVGRFMDNEEGFLREWAWRTQRGKTFPALAEPFRMTKKFMEQEGMIRA